MSAADRHGRVQALFDRVCDLGAEEREAELAQVDDADLVEEVVALLGAEAAADALEAPAAEHMGELPGSGLPAFRSGGSQALPDRIGDFTIRGLLGEGGMGIVYEAEEHSPPRRVALKLIREGFVTEEHLRRFQREAEALALIEHPGVARIYAAGTVAVDGRERPYIALELVRGVSIVDYARARNLDYSERLELVVQLLDAVHHAHGRGIVHRDLKPANVLVTEEGDVKVLDFGIARIADPEGTRMTSVTDLGQVLGTLSYMSPEQINPAQVAPEGLRPGYRGAAEAAIDMRADVYTVGVIAYELLAGQLPFDVQRRTLVEAARIIALDEPTRLGSIDTRLRGDLNWIVHKALSKERDERYGSALEFRQDIERYLGDEPVLARPPSSVYQLRKFARRNRGLVAGFAAAFAALAVGLIAVSVLLSKTSSLLEQRDEEVAAADEALTFMEGLFAQTDPLQEGNVSLSEMTVRAAEAFEGELKERPVQRARLLNSIGKTMIDLGMASGAAPLLDEALEIRAVKFGEASVPYAQTLERVARIHQMEGRHQKAYGLQQRVVAIRRDQLGPSELLADALSNMAITAGFLGDREQATRLRQEALQMLTDAFGDLDRRAISCRVQIAASLAYSGRAEEALVQFDELIGLESHAPPHVAIEMRTQKAWALRFLGRLDESLVVLDEARALAVERYGDEVAFLRQIDSGRAMALSGMGRTEEAVAILRATLERTIASDGDDSMTVASMTHDLAYVVHDLPGPANAEAEVLYRKAIERFDAAADLSGGFVPMARHNLALWLEGAGRLDEALVEVTAAYEDRRDLLGNDDQNTLASLRGLAGVLATMKRHAESADRYAEFVEVGAAVMGESSFPVQTARLQLAAEEVRAGNEPAARKHIAVAAQLAEQMHDPAAFKRRIQRAESQLFPEGRTSR